MKWLRCLSLSKTALALLLIFSSFSAQAFGPVAPTKEVTNKNLTPSTTNVPDLPYKPPAEDTEIVTDDGGTETMDAENEKPFDWAVMPYVPDKLPELPVAADPKI